jgi:hypothetical protein
MAHFINTFATNKIYRRLIDQSEERLVFLLPFLKLHPVLIEALDARKRPKLDLLFVYSHGRLTKQEVAWLKSQPHVRTRRCPMIHMRCCANEREIFVTSKGPYRLDTKERYDMGFLVVRDEDPEMFKAMHDDIYRIVGDSREAVPAPYLVKPANQPADELLPDWVIAERMKLSLNELYDLLIKDGYLVRGKDRKLALTPKGLEVGGKESFSRRYGPHFVWPRGVS